MGRNHGLEELGDPRQYIHPSEVHQWNPEVRSIEHLVHGRGKSGHAEPGGVELDAAFLVMDLHQVDRRLMQR